MADFILMCGIPGSGKTTKAKKIAKECSAVYISSDDLREELFEDATDQNHNEEVFTEMNKRTVKALKENKNVVYDSCNISRKRRMTIIRQFKRYNPKFICALCYNTYEKCLENNRKRERVVPDDAVLRMMMNFYFPQKFEGWDEIKIYIPKDMNPEKDIKELFYGENGLCNIKHDNHHHSMTIGYHCIATFLDCLAKHPNIDYIPLHVAALLHDIGKPLCKSFKDSKGNISEEAHYYQHHLASAYIAFPYVVNCDICGNLHKKFEIIALIDYHMQPYFWEKDNNEDMRKKYLEIWGEDLYDKIMLLHEADKMAH